MQDNEGRRMLCISRDGFIDHELLRLRVVKIEPLQRVSRDAHESVVINEKSAQNMLPAATQRVRKEKRASCLSGTMQKRRIGPKESAPREQLGEALAEPVGFLLAKGKYVFHPRSIEADGSPLTATRLAPVQGTETKDGHC